MALNSQKAKLYVCTFVNNANIILNLYLLNNELIQIVKETKFLRITFDSKLTFIPHIKYLKPKCLKALSLLRVVAHTDWGADYTTLMRIYTSYIRSKLDYGSIVYGSGRKSYLQALDPIHNQALRLCLGAYRTSPCQSLYAEINKLSLNLRRKMLSVNYTLKLKSNPNNSTYISVFNQQNLPLNLMLFLLLDYTCNNFSPLPVLN